MNTVQRRLNERFRGDWDSAIQYVTGDRVDLDGSVYYALLNNSNSNPSSSSLIWQLRLVPAAISGLFTEDNQLLIKRTADNGIDLVDDVVGGVSVNEGDVFTVDEDPLSNSGIIFREFNSTVEAKALSSPVKDLPTLHPSSTPLSLTRSRRGLGDLAGRFMYTSYVRSSADLVACGVHDPGFWTVQEINGTEATDQSFPSSGSGLSIITPRNNSAVSAHPISVGTITFQGFTRISLHRMFSIIETYIDGSARIFARGILPNLADGRNPDDTLAVTANRRAHFVAVSVTLPTGVSDAPNFIDVFGMSYFGALNANNVFPLHLEANGIAGLTDAGEIYYAGYDDTDVRRLGTTADFGKVNNLTRIEIPGTFFGMVFGHNTTYYYLHHTDGTVTFNGYLTANECGNPNGIRLEHNTLEVMITDPVVKIQVSGVHYGKDSIAEADQRFKNTFLTDAGVVYSLEHESGAFVQANPIIDPDILDNTEILDIWSVRQSEDVSSGGAEFCLFYLKGDPNGQNNLELRCVSRGTFVGITSSSREDRLIDNTITPASFMDGTFKGKAGPGCFHWINSDDDMMGIGHNHDGRLGVGNTDTLQTARRCIGVFGIVADWEYQMVNGTGVDRPSVVSINAYAIITKVIYTNGRASACGSVERHCLGTVTTSHRGAVVDHGDNTRFTQVALG